jgi:hypothetical protein
MSEDRERMTKAGTDEPGTEDVEGHRSVKSATDEPGDEVEGHMTGRKASDDPYGGDDDVEGHAHKKL